MSRRLPSVLGGSSVVKVLGRSTGLRWGVYARALRTQQRVRHRALTGGVPLSREGAVLATESSSVPTNRCSTLEHLLTDSRGQTRLWIACATSAP